MAQHDYIISNQTFPNTRADINSVLSAIATNNSGTSAPTTQYAGQFWIDTTSSTWTLYIHDGSDDIAFATIDTSANTVNFLDSTFDLINDTTPQLGGNLDTNGNSINFADNIKALFGGGNDLQIYHDGTHSYIRDSGTGNLKLRSDGAGVEIKKNDTEDMAKFLTDGAVELYHDNSKKLETTSGGVDITGTITTDGLTVNTGAIVTTTYGGTNGAGRVQFGLSGSAYIEGQDDGFGGSGANITMGINTTDHLKIATNGDISFYEDTGTTPKFFWDASTERLGIGTTSPSQALDVVGSIEVSDGIYIGGTGSANKLDDYEEGTWTPVYSFGSGSVTYFAQNGIYTKIGNVVYYAVSIATSSISSPSGNVSITGLPFAVDDSTASPGATIGLAYRWGTDMPNLSLRPTSSDGIQFWKNATNSTSATRVTGSDFTSGSGYNNISFSGSYITTA